MKIQRVVISTLVFVVGLTTGVFAAEDVSKTMEKVEVAEEHKLTPDLGFNFNGYVRTGVLFSISDGFNGGLYKNDAALGATGGSQNSASKWRVGRLGNEPDNYWEVGFDKSFLFGGSNWGKFNFMLAQGDQFDNGTWLENGLVFREGYFEGGGFSVNPDLIVWAGKRYNYHHHAGIHIIDFFYRDYLGTGAGVENLAGFIELGYLAGDGNIVTVDAGGVAPADRKTIVHNVHTQLAFGDDQKFKLNIVGQAQQNATLISETSADGGVQVDVELALNPVTLVLQYGYGIGANLGQMNYGGEDQGDNAIRFLTFFDHDGKNTPLSLQTSAWVEYNSNEIRNDQIQTSIVTRPTAHLNKYFALVAELGLSHNSDLESSLYDTQYKLTFAPTFQFDVGVWARPQIRAFITYNGWEGEGAREYQWTKEDGDLVAGTQLEIWF
jgi:maltoporin